jgi:hypothetical protein
VNVSPRPACESLRKPVVTSLQFLNKRGSDDMRVVIE